MRDLTVVQLRNGLDDLLTHRRTHIQQTTLGAPYLPLLDGVLAELSQLVKGDTPFIEELKGADQRHDGYLRALHALRDSLAMLPGLDPEVGTVLVALKVALPPLIINRASYLEEAEVALERAPNLRQMRDSLTKIPVPGGDLNLWIEGYLSAAADLKSLLSQRAQSLEALPARTSTLRPKAIGLLHQLRAAIASELAFNAELPENLDTLIFGYFDGLAR